MGHTRLGSLPKTQKWNELIRYVAGIGSARDIPTAAAVDAIAAQTLDAAQGALMRAAQDSGVCYTFYLMTQLAVASRTSEWEKALSNHGIDSSQISSVSEFTFEVQDAIDRYINQSSSGATDLSEIAQQSAGEALTSLAGPRTADLFGGDRTEVRKAIRSLSTKQGFGELGQRFFARFVARFLNFYLSRVTAANLGKPRLKDLGAIAEFDQALQLHCEQSARIVRDFCGEWYSKTEYQRGIDLETTSRFMAVALKKLRSELEQQKAAL